MKKIGSGQLMTGAAVAFAVFALWYITRKPAAPGVEQAVSNSALGTVGMGWYTGTDPKEVNAVNSSIMGVYDPDYGPMLGLA